MLNAILKWSIAQRWLVVIGAIIVTVWGFITVSQMPLDVFPNFAPPQVEIQTEAPGLAPEEVESLVTLPIESAINGTPGIQTVRSSSAVGISVVKVTFNWDTDIYQARQLVTERLQQAATKLPEGIETPQISPISSPIGTVIQYAFSVAGENTSLSTGEFNQNARQQHEIFDKPAPTSLMDLRQLVDRDIITNRLLAVPGVTQVIAYGEISVSIRYWLTLPSCKLLMSL